MPRHAALFGLAFLGLTVTTPAQADPPPCTCRNLESLQQEYQNAVYMEGYMRRLAEHLKGVEAKQAALNATSSASPEAGDSVGQKSANAREAYKAANWKLPFPQPKDYKGPPDVSMIPGQCQQSTDDLDGVRDGSPCEAIADAALAHEQAHVDICRNLGVQAYWGRMPSVFALEEAEMYKIQAANLKAELRRVMDVSDLRLVGEFRQKLGDDSATYSDEITFDSGDLKLSSQGGDRWTMTSEGDTVSMVVLDVVSPEPQVCMSQPVRDSFSVTLKTDGLTFDVETTGHDGHEATISCNGGLSVPFFGSPFGGAQARRLKVAMGDTPLPSENDWLLSAIVGAAASGGASMSTVQTATLRLTCEGQ
ncbi:MAG: hypothetical protein MUE52_13535 [Tabrizicola sp.]|jgi:hypothetical protein|nr:hypothetical protein [Tabrizicola sp.]